jgi:alpha-L-fucosidase
MMKWSRLSALILALFGLAGMNWGGGYVPTQENLASREWFQNARFGLFIHWGVYSVEGRGEWLMHNERMSIEEYGKLPHRFNPTAFDADAWCEMAKDAGMNYITITSKHHDGFAMFDSKMSDYDIVDASPYGKDVLKQLADACRRHGLKLFLYHSHLDWHHPDYYPRGRTGQYSGRPDKGNFSAYLDYMDAQLAELCTNYGPIGGIWFDGMWDRPDADWRLEKTYGLIHRLQPQAMIGSNHHRKPFPGEDFQMFEKGLPGQDPFSTEKHVSESLPLEMCDTINSSWGYNAGDNEHKSVKELVHLLVKASGYGANLLLNVGPKPDGTIQDTHRNRLAEVGAWLRKNGAGIYGTRKGPVAPRSWGVTTRKENKVYVHILTESDDVVALPDFGNVVSNASLLDGRPVSIASTSLGTIIQVPSSLRDPIDTIIVLTLE